MPRVLLGGKDKGSTNIHDKDPYSSEGRILVVIIFNTFVFLNIEISLKKLRKTIKQNSFLSAALWWLLSDLNMSREILQHLYKSVTFTIYNYGYCAFYLSNRVTKETQVNPVLCNIIEEVMLEVRPQY